MKRFAILIAALGLLLVGAPASAQSSGTGHVTGTVPESLVFQFTTPSSVAVGALPVGSFADAQFGYTLQANGNWNLTATSASPAGLGASYQKEGIAGFTDMTNGVPLALRSGGPTAGVGWTDTVRVTNNSAPAGAFDVAITWTIALA